MLVDVDGSSPHPGVGHTLKGIGRGICAAVSERRRRIREPRLKKRQQEKNGIRDVDVTVVVAIERTPTLWRATAKVARKQNIERTDRIGDVERPIVVRVSPEKRRILRDGPCTKRDHEYKDP